MISYLIGLSFLIVGFLLLTNLVRGHRGTTKKRRVDPTYFKSMQVTFPEKSPSMARKANSKPKPSFDFDFGEEAKEEVQPIGLSQPEKFSLGGFDLLPKSQKQGGIGFDRPDEDEDDGPKQGTLGF